MKFKVVTIAVSSLLASNLAFAASEVHWGYSGAEGPENWGNLSPDFAVCSTGKNQSPVNLTGMIEGELPDIKIQYKAGGNEIVNNGHTIKINYSEGSSIAVDSRSFELKQFHFHSPSENTIEGKSFPLEAHFVHADEAGNLAVIAVMYKEGKQNNELGKVWQYIPENMGEKQVLKKVTDANLLLPKDHSYYRFNGSLTTPPCTEGVSWFVMKSIETVSIDQISEFVHVMHHENNRPVQHLNARLVIE